MNPRRIALAVILAVVIAAIVSYAFMMRMRAEQADQLKTVKLVAATKPLAAGTPITADSVGLIDWPAKMPVTGSFTKLDDVVGRSVIYPIEEHQPIVDHDVAQAGSGIGLTVKIPEGMRAVSVRSNDVVGVAGFLYPGSHVDVLLTMDKDLQYADHPQTHTILSNVEVLTAGQRIEPDPKGKPETVNVVTLLLKPEDGEKMVLAASQGKIQFVLRNGADQNMPKTGPVDLADLMLGEKKPPAPKQTDTRRVAKRAVHVEKPQTVVYEVETISGNKRKVDKFESR
jgi:pilus assembly protein CpaB